jgi:hypothetical protein
MRATLLLLFTILAFSALGQKSVNERFKTYIREKKRTKEFILKDKNSNSKRFYYFNKANSHLAACQVIEEHNLTKYFFEDGQPIFIIYMPRRDNDKQVKGGLYYFIDGKLQQKEEYNIAPREESELLAETNKLLASAQVLLMKK